LCCGFPNNKNITPCNGLPINKSFRRSPFTSSTTEIDRAFPSVTDISPCCFSSDTDTGHSADGSRRSTGPSDIDGANDEPSTTYVDPTAFKLESIDPDKLMFASGSRLDRGRLPNRNNTCLNHLRLSVHRDSHNPFTHRLWFSRPPVNG
jgi:hypothetical protein